MHGRLRQWEKKKECEAATYSRNMDDDLHELLMEDIEMVRQRIKGGKETKRKNKEKRKPEELNLLA